jgi:hypothetical protein
VVRDVVYFLKESPPRPELQFSLRSLAMTDHGTVWFVGGCPDWVRNVNHVPFPDGEFKWWTLNDKFMLLPGLDGLSDEFVLMSDDYFFLRPCDSFPNYVDRERLSYRIRRLGDVSNPTGRSGWLAEARDVCRAQGVADPFMFDVHTPSLYNRHLIPLHLYRGTPLSWRSVYGNLIVDDPVEIPLDPKSNSSARITKLAELDIGLLSTSEHSFTASGAERLLAGLFPEPSPFER